MRCGVPGSKFLGWLDEGSQLWCATPHFQCGVGCGLVWCGLGKACGVVAWALAGLSRGASLGLSVRSMEWRRVAQELSE